MSLSTQEKKFADEYVFQYFHTSNDISLAPVYAAEYAGYDVPKDVIKAAALVHNLLGKTEIKEYIDSEIERFKGILANSQRRNLWAYLSTFTSGEPEDFKEYGSIIRH